MKFLHISINFRKSSTGGGGGPGKPIDDGEREKWISFGALVAMGLIAALVYYRLGFKEITWKEFSTKYSFTLRTTFFF